MKKTLFIIILSLLSLVRFSHATSQEDIDQELKLLSDKTTQLEAINMSLNTEVSRLRATLSAASAKIDDLHAQASANSKVFKQAIQELDSKINDLHAQVMANSNAFNQLAQELDLKIDVNAENANKKIVDVDNSLSRITLWAIIGILAAIVISGIVYWLLSNKQQAVKTDVIAQLSKTKLAIDENLVKEFDKQAEAAVALLKLLGEQKSNSNIEPDHSLPLKVANEVNTIERNISLMDAGTRGLKQLARSVEKLKDNLTANGYEMPKLLGRPFQQGMNVIVINSIPDENLENGTEIITKILIPQINYNGIMIQAAQIEVSVG